MDVIGCGKWARTTIFADFLLVKSLPFSIKIQMQETRVYFFRVFNRCMPKNCKKNRFVPSLLHWWNWVPISTDSSTAQINRHSLSVSLEHLHSLINPFECLISRIIYAEKYMGPFNERDWCIRGLWLGSRGTLGISEN